MNKKKKIIFAVIIVVIIAIVAVIYGINYNSDSISNEENLTSLQSSPNASEGFKEVSVGDSLEDVNTKMGQEGVYIGPTDHGYDDYSYDNGDTSIHIYFKDGKVERSAIIPN